MPVARSPLDRSRRGALVRRTPSPSSAPDLLWLIVAATLAIAASAALLQGGISGSTGHV